MNFPDALFPQAWALGAFIPLVATWLWAMRTSPWRELADAGRLNLWSGTVVILVLIWSMKAGVKPGQDLHLLGATLFTLMFGWRLAIMGLSLVLAGVSLNAHVLGHPAWEAYALSALVTVVIPVVVANSVRMLAERHLPQHFFVFVFVVAFLGSALAIVSTGLASTSLMWLAGVYPLHALLDDYLPYYFLLGFAEAWLNGAMITVLVVYLPHWVGSFDDRRYLLHK